MIPDSYRFAILFGAWLRPEELPRGAQMELRWDVARDYLSACDRRGSGSPGEARRALQLSINNGIIG